MANDTWTWRATPYAPNAINPKTGSAWTFAEFKTAGEAYSAAQPVGPAPYPTTAEAVETAGHEAWSPETVGAGVFPPWMLPMPAAPTGYVHPAAPVTPVTPAVAPTTEYPGYGTTPYFEAGEMLTAPMSTYETEALQMLSDLAGQLGGMVSPWETAMGEQVSTALTSLLSGEFPEEYFRTAIEAPAQKRLEEVTLPGVREAYVGPGTFWGGERAEAERRAGTDVDMMLAAVRGDLGYRARQQALETLGPAMEYMGLPADQLLKQVAGVTPYMGAAALPRLIEQHGLDIAYQEFIRTRPENQPYAQMLLSLLNIPMLASYAPEAPESPLAPIASMFGSLVPLLSML